MSGIYIKRHIIWNIFILRLHTFLLFSRFKNVFTSMLLPVEQDLHQDGWCSRIYYHDIEPSTQANKQPIRPWVVAISTGDGHGDWWKRNGPSSAYNSTGPPPRLLAWPIIFQLYNHTAVHHHNRQHSMQLMVNMSTQPGHPFVGRRSKY